MTALPSGSGYNTRGTIGTAHENTTVRVDYERMLAAILKDLRFFQPKFMVQKKIPRKQNERVRFNRNQRANGAVYQIDEHGLQTAGTNSIGGAQSAGTDVPTITLNMDYVEATIKRYGSVFQWTAIAESVSERDLRPWGLSEQGIIVAEQLDTLTKGLFDSYAQDLYPKSTITSDADADFTATDVFNYAFLVKIRTYLRSKGFHPPKGQKNFPMILPYDALAGLMLDTAFATMLRESAVRRDPVATPFDELFVGSLCGFDFYESNRLVAVPGGPTNSFNIGRLYVYTDEAVGCLAMEDASYGPLPSDNGNSPSNQAGEREWDTNPQPVSTIFHDYGSGALGKDVFKDHAAVVEKHTIGMVILNPGRLIRGTFAVGDAGNIGLAAAPPATGSV